MEHTARCARGAELEAAAGLVVVWAVASGEMAEEEEEEAAEEEEEPDDATGSRKVVVGKLACNIAMAIQLFLVVLSNFATGRFTFF